jgi:uncharacterized protein with GYD domain
MRMPQYVILWNWNEQGIKTAKDSLNRLSSFKKEMENAGGKNNYCTLYIWRI